MAKTDAATVLIVDDEITNIEVLGFMLSGMCEVIFARSGEECLAMAREEGPDLILLDVMMPGLDGYETCLRLKGDPATAHIPVIFVTALDRQEDEARGLEVGAIDYLTKPLQPGIARARVKNHLALKRQQDSLRSLVAATERVKARFLSLVNHEMKSPLAPILGMTELMLDQSLEPAHRRYVQAIQMSARKLLGMVEDLIDINRIEADIYPYEPAPLDLREALSALVEELRPQADLKAITLAFEARNPEPIELNLDADTLQRAMGILVGNAIRYTPAGEVRVLLEVGTRGRVKVSVVDQGPGIPPERRERIFEDLSQGEEGLSRNQGGMGLGLSLCRRLVLLMGASIRVDGEQGRGARFEIEWRLHDASA